MARYAEEFRDDVVAVARSRDEGVTLRQIADDFGISEATLSNWLEAADVESGKKPGVTSDVAASSKLARSCAWSSWPGSNASTTGNVPGLSRRVDPVEYQYKITVMNAIAKGASAIACLASGLALGFATLMAGLSTHYSWLRQWPDEVVLPGAFSVGVVVCVIVGKVMDRGTVGYAVGLVVVAAIGAVFVISPDQFS